MLVDISATGARLRTAELPQFGEEMMVSVETIRAFGCVAWVRGDQFGIAFDEALPPAAVLQLRTRLSRSAGLPLEMSAAMDDWATGLAR